MPLQSVVFVWNILLSFLFFFSISSYPTWRGPTSQRWGSRYCGSVRQERYSQPSMKMEAHQTVQSFTIDTRDVLGIVPKRLGSGKRQSGGFEAQDGFDKPCILNEHRAIFAHHVLLCPCMCSSRRLVRIREYYRKEHPFRGRCLPNMQHYAVQRSYGQTKKLVRRSQGERRGKKRQEYQRK